MHAEPGIKAGRPPSVTLREHVALSHISSFSPLPRKASQAPRRRKTGVSGMAREVHGQSVYARDIRQAAEAASENTMKESALRDLYIDELRDIYNAENQLTKALPKMAKAAVAKELRAGFEEHLKQTEGHVRRLEQIFKDLDENPTGKKCKGMAGLIEEGKEMIQEGELEGETLDAGLISAGARVGHYQNA